MITALLVDDLTQLVDIMDVFGNPMLFHVFHETLLLWNDYVYNWILWNTLGRACNGCVLNFETPRIVGCIEHTTYPSKLLLAKSSIASAICTSTLVDHTFDEVCCELWLRVQLRLGRLDNVLVLNLNLFLFHLNLNVSDSRWGLAIDNEVWRRWRRLPYLVLANDLDASVVHLGAATLVGRLTDKASH